MKNKYKLVLQTEFLEDLRWWVTTDRKVALTILKLMEEIHRNPTKGIGKPERLKHFKSNIWSRKITREHRLVYRIKESAIHFLQCRYHY
ncbi:MAG: Txe/YoeB family addiction module toxin [Balneolales bacterium]